MIKNKAFTLIELLVVIAIIALLLSILLPALKKAKDQAKAVVCGNHLKQIGIAFNTYAEENDKWIPRSEVNTGIDWSVPEPFTGNWQIAFSPYLAGGQGFTGYWEVGAYNCPSYPRSEQLMDFVINAWDYKLGEHHGHSKLTSIRNISGLVYLSEYAYYYYSVNASGMLELAGDPPTGSDTQIISEEDVRTYTPKQLYDKMKWMDIWEPRHLPGSSNPDVASGGPGNSRRIAYNRHKKNGTNNLFFDTHVEWMHADSQTPEKWRVRE